MRSDLAAHDASFFRRDEVIHRYWRKMALVDRRKRSPLPSLFRVLQSRSFPFLLTRSCVLSSKIHFAPCAGASEGTGAGGLFYMRGSREGRTVACTAGAEVCYCCSAGRGDAHDM